MRDIRDETRRLPDDATVVIVDDRTTRVNMAAAFGTLLNEAILLESGRHLNVWIDPPVPGAEGQSPPCASCVSLKLRVVNGRLMR
jgi:hypothetical protein